MGVEGHKDTILAATLSGWHLAWCRAVGKGDAFQLGKGGRSYSINKR